MDVDDYYNSNITDTDNTYFNWGELIPTVVVYSLTFILGLVGNCLIIFTTFQYRRMQSITNVFLCSLASADLLLILICIPVKLAKLFSYTWGMGYFVCKTVYYMQNVSAICSVMTLTAISIERYYAIVHPMKSKYICTIKKAKRIIWIIWAISFLMAVPTLFIQIHLPVSDSGNEYFHCVKNIDHEFIWRSHEIYILCIILIGPFCIMTFSYTMICWEVWQVMERRSVMTSKDALKRTRSNNEEANHENFALTEDKKTKTNYRDDTNMVKQVICMLIAVVVLFAICWAPMLTDNLLTAYGYLSYYRSGPHKHMNIAFNLLAYFNSCINPIIYGFMSKSFRESSMLVLCCTSSEARLNSVSNSSLKYASPTRHTHVR